MSCDHRIAILYDYEYSEPVRISDYKEKILDRVDIHGQMVDLFNGQPPFKKRTKPKDFFDQRRCMSDMFKFCPDCGEKINWKKIKEDLNDV